jgi:phage-related minor tail protein
MTDSQLSNHNRSVSVGGNAIGAIIQTGDSNQASLNFQSVPLPDPQSVDIQATLSAIRDTLSQLDSSDRKKIDNALSEAEDELKKPQPDKDEVGQALDRAVKYAEKANGFAVAVEKLKPHVTNAVSWLGENWLPILAKVGLTAIL